MAHSLPDNQPLLPRKQRRQVDAPAARQLRGLGAAREAIRQVHGIRLRRQGGQQRMGCDGHRQVVVARLHAEVSGQAAAALEPGHARPQRLEQRLVTRAPSDSSSAWSTSHPMTE